MPFLSPASRSPCPHRFPIFPPSEGCFDRQAKVGRESCCLLARKKTSARQGESYCLPFVACTDYQPDCSISYGLSTLHCCLFATIRTSTIVKVRHVWKVSCRYIKAIPSRNITADGRPTYCTCDMRPLLVKLRRIQPPADFSVNHLIFIRRLRSGWTDRESASSPTRWVFPFIWHLQ